MSLVFKILCLLLLLPLFSGCDEELLTQLREQQARLGNEELLKSLESSSSPLAADLKQQLAAQGNGVSSANISQYLAAENSDPQLDKTNSSGITDEASIGLDASTLHLINAIEIPICQRLKVTVPRGLACMHCMHPKARTQAKVLQVVMLKSCLKNIATNYLVDGTFDFDSTHLLSDITTLSTGGRRLFVNFFITNGPSQRRYKTSSITSFGTRISPQQFREQILSDIQTQSEYQQLVRRIVPVMRYAASIGSAVTIIPALEDNLSDEAFQKLGELTLDAVPNDIRFAIGRNPCPGCYSGNGKEIPRGYFKESHTASPFISDQNGVVSNDGTDYAFNPKDVLDQQVTLADLEAVRDAAARKNNIFILWSGKRQGFANYNGTATSYPDPAVRNYQIPSIAERKALVKFLRAQ